MFELPITFGIPLTIMLFVYYSYFLTYLVSIWYCFLLQEKELAELQQLREEELVHMTAVILGVNQVTVAW